MFKDISHSGLLSLFSNLGRNPLMIWHKEVRNGHIKQVMDNDTKSMELELEEAIVIATYITCPADPKMTLGIKLPFLVVVVKNLKKAFTYEVQLLDDKNNRRRFRASTDHSTTRVKPYICTMPLRLGDDWNQILFNLQSITRRAYGTNYIETLRVRVSAWRPTRSRLALQMNLCDCGSSCLMQMNLNSFPSRSTLTVEYREYTSRTECTPRTSSQPSSNSTGHREPESREVDLPILNKPSGPDVESHSLRFLHVLINIL
uniref:CFA20 domain-containing protein n=1 Tax=Gasterosteus aculeatus aculeatus TaxID=481459 RepID=A0AAQ4PBX0_GASAC